MSFVGWFGGGLFVLVYVCWIFILGAFFDGLHYMIFCNNDFFISWLLYEYYLALMWCRWMFRMRFVCLALCLVK